MKKANIESLNSYSCGPNTFCEGTFLHQNLTSSSSPLSICALGVSKPRKKDDERTRNAKTPPPLYHLLPSPFVVVVVVYVVVAFRNPFGDAKVSLFLFILWRGHHTREKTRFLYLIIASREKEPRVVNRVRGWFWTKQSPFGDAKVSLLFLCILLRLLEERTAHARRRDYFCISKIASREKEPRVVKRVRGWFWNGRPTTRGDQHR